jgi:hypothetical protein
MFGHIKHNNIQKTKTLNYEKTSFSIYVNLHDAYGASKKILRKPNWK